MIPTTFYFYRCEAINAQRTYQIAFVSEVFENPDTIIEKTHATAAALFDRMKKIVEKQELRLADAAEKLESRFNLYNPLLKKRVRTLSQQIIKEDLEHFKAELPLEELQIYRDNIKESNGYNLTLKDSQNRWHSNPRFQSCRDLNCVLMTCYDLKTRQSILDLKFTKEGKIILSSLMASKEIIRL